MVRSDIEFWGTLRMLKGSQKELKFSMVGPMRFSWPLSQPVTLSPIADRLALCSWEHPTEPEEGPEQEGPKRGLDISRNKRGKEHGGAGHLSASTRHQQVVPYTGNDNRTIHAYNKTAKVTKQPGLNRSQTEVKMTPIPAPNTAHVKKQEKKLQAAISEQ